jgi:hypothetical protein
MMEPTMHKRHTDDSDATSSTQVFSYGIGIFGCLIECRRLGDEFFLYGVTASGDPRVLPSLGVAREVAASAMP